MKFSVNFIKITISNLLFGLDEYGEIFFLICSTKQKTRISLLKRTKILFNLRDFKRKSTNEVIKQLSERFDKVKELRNSIKHLLNSSWRLPNCIQLSTTVSRTYKSLWIIIVN
jgi:hypothetical protein